MKIKRLVHFMVFGMVTCYGDVFASIHFLIRPRTQHKGLNQGPREDSANLDREDDYQKYLRLAAGICAMPHKENPVLAVKELL